MKSNTSLAIPIAIVIAAALIAGSLYLAGSREPLTLDTTPESDTEDIAIRPLDANDHILGNPNAPILLIEYSDYDCPYCKQFHETMTQIIEEYGATGEVAWVYRHFPLTSLHPNAITLAEASECVAELGGNEAFWTFSDLIFAEREVNAQTDLERLPEFAIRAGVDSDAFETCLASGKYATAIQDSIADAVATGGRGTPHTIIVAGDETGAISGAQPYTTVKGIIEDLLSSR
ncbi:DsbA family protein [Candidatus Kaiserbacteria bacterium]|nr:DsbA family protein [Candidatus Kaiserbacteria bacterium]